MLELNKIYNCNCLDGLKQLEDNSVDLTVTSPPYDNLRSYRDKNTGSDAEWDFEIFKPIAQELYRVTKKGGVVVWIVGDACIDNGETGSSFRQALYFQELGFKIHDTMIYEKNSSSFPARLTSKRYSQIFEYMFVFSKGKIRGDIKLIADKRNKWAGWTNWGDHSQYDAEGNLVKTQNIKPIAEYSLRTNIWRYPVSFNDKTGHPAVFPEKLAEDHILSWSNEGETVLDPFMGSGTTAKMAMLNGRNYIGFELNSGYYEESLKRVEKYIGKQNDKLSSVSVEELVNIDSEDVDTEDIQLNPVDDKDLEKKNELWKELTSELEDYFNTQSLGILKNLRVNLTFASKANDKRVEKVLQERGVLPQTENAVTIESVILKADTPDSNGRVYSSDALQEAVKNFNETKQRPPYGELSHQQEREFKMYFDGKVLTVEQKEEIRKIANEEIDRRMAELSKKAEICRKEYEAPETTVIECETILNTEKSQAADEQAVEEQTVIVEKKKRGRPKGSKNKVNTENSVAVAEEAAAENTSEAINNITEEKEEVKEVINKTIEKTSNEEGKYAEYIVEYLSRATNARYEDVSNNPEYQKMDIDALINGAKIEIKNDTIIHGSGNAVYEKNTHVHHGDIVKLKEFLQGKDYVNFDELPAEYGSKGCNEKCNADKIFYISSIESDEKKKHYKINWRQPAFLIDNKKFKEYVRNNPIPASSVKMPYHKEDSVYNIIITYKIEQLIADGIARRVNAFTLEAMKKRYDVFNEYHTSQEIKQLLLENA